MKEQFSSVDSERVARNTVQDDIHGGDAHERDHDRDGRNPVWAQQLAQCIPANGDDDEDGPGDDGDGSAGPGPGRQTQLSEEAPGRCSSCGWPANSWP